MLIMQQAAKKAEHWQATVTGVSNPRSSGLQPSILQYPMAHVVEAYKLSYTPHECVDVTDSSRFSSSIFNFILACLKLAPIAEM